MEEIRIECPEIFDFEQCLEYFKRNEMKFYLAVVDREIYKASVKLNNSEYINTRIIRTTLLKTRNFKIKI